jgi:hypothetical protein
MADLAAVTFAAGPAADAEGARRGPIRAFGDGGTNVVSWCKHFDVPSPSNHKVSTMLISTGQIEVVRLLAELIL